MTATDARRTLDSQDAAIAANVADYLAGRITHAEFTARQYAAHDAIQAAWRREAYLRWWRRSVGEQRDNKEHEA